MQPGRKIIMLDVESIETAIKQAIEKFAAKTAVPILVEINSETVDQVGTGTLFSHQDRLFLVTARHIFDDIDPRTIVIPSTDTTELASIGSLDLLRPDQEQIDVAVVELKHPPTIKRAKASWNILTVDDTAQASFDGVFALSGYPSERLRRDGGLLGGSLITVYTDRIVEIPSEATAPVHRDVDLFFTYDSKLVKSDGEILSAPNLRGCSGASIWQYIKSEDAGLWTAQKSLRIIGVQSAYRKGKYFRGIAWHYVLEIFKKLDLV